MTTFEIINTCPKFGFFRSAVTSMVLFPEKSIVAVIIQAHKDGMPYCNRYPLSAVHPKLRITLFRLLVGL